MCLVQAQILESMLEENNPSRQELTEITTATRDGADGFILSHETSVGKHAIEATINLAKAELMYKMTIHPMPSSLLDYH